MGEIDHDIVELLASHGHTVLADQLRHVQPESPLQALVLKGLMDAGARPQVDALAAQAERLLATDTTDLLIVQQVITTLQHMRPEDRDEMRAYVAKVRAALDDVGLGLLRLLVDVR